MLLLYCLALLTKQFDYAYKLLNGF